MNRHVGASFTLSVLIVVFFAIILYEPDRTQPTAPPSSSTPATTAESSSPPGDTPPPPSGVPLPLIEASSEPLLEASRTPSPPPSLSPPRSRPAAASSSPAPVASTKPPVPSPRVLAEPPAMIQITSRRRLLKPGRHSAFTQVGEGESLTDVALRVYGTPEATSTLWRANRDIIARREAPLDVGLLLRTP